MFYRKKYKDLNAEYESLKNDYNQALTELSSTRKKVSELQNIINALKIKSECSFKDNNYLIEVMNLIHQHTSILKQNAQSTIKRSKHVEAIVKIVDNYFQRPIA